MDCTHYKWVACWGNATSITDRKEATYGRDLTLRYPLPMCFDGEKLRLRFSNLTGTEPVCLTRALVARTDPDAPTGRRIMAETSTAVTFSGREEAVIAPGGELLSDAIDFAVRAGEAITVSLYFAGFVQLSAGTLVTGPLSRGYFAYGPHAEDADLPDDLTRNTSWFYFLNTAEVLTEPRNRALICYGDSITAQSWPDLLTLRLRDEGIGDVAIIRRAVSGTRVLRQYDCITYAAYGLRGAVRFPTEMRAAGAATIILQQGINDIIHPVGTEVNRFRPLSDLPTAQELYDGFCETYIRPAKAAGLRVYTGTLLPILGWRTYAPFREELRVAFNRLLMESREADGCIDFAAAVCDAADARAFGAGMDSGDHLHPSEEGYRRMAACVPDEVIQG